VIAVLRFLFSAYRAGVAYIDVDGCVLKKFPVPSYVPKHESLNWWKEHLKPTQVVFSRIVLCYVLSAIGVRLILWTNRRPTHRPITYLALRSHWKLFDWDEMYFCEGQKERVFLEGPVMDDDPKYVALGVGYSLLVESR
jgi:hypothetical protein